MTDYRNLKLGKNTTEDGLDPVPRRRTFKEPAAPMFGYDLWNAYEVSFLLPDGRPFVGHLQAVYNADSPYLVESKSFKLYLNARNMRVFESKEAFAAELNRDLSACVGAPVSFTFYTAESSPALKRLNTVCLDSQTLNQAIPSQPNPALLGRVEQEGGFGFHSHLLRSNCPVTNQPDWATVIIEGAGPHHPEPSSLLAYLISYRSHQDFHESCCETIYQDLYRCLNPDRLTIRCLYTRRGGLDINAHRSNQPLETTWVEPVWRQ